MNPTSNHVKAAVLAIIFTAMNCGVQGSKSEIEVCRNDAADELAGCLLSYVYVQQNIWNVPINTQPEVTEFVQNYCLVQYQQRMKCPDQSKYIPTRGD